LTTHNAIVSDLVPRVGVERRPDGRSIPHIHQKAPSRPEDSMHLPQYVPSVWVRKVPQRIAHDQTVIEALGEKPRVSGARPDCLYAVLVCGGMRL
jgi:hypothetical protein